MLKPGKKSLDLLETIKQLGNGLQKLTDNPEGGKLTVDIEETGQQIVFTMPPKKDRKKLI